VNNLVVLRNLFLKLRPERTLEIGMSFGGSCLVFTASHRDVGNAPDRQHLALDPYQGTVWDDCGVMITERAGLTGWLDYRSALSALELPTLLREGRQFEIAYIDGSHLFEDVFVDCYFTGRLIVNGGVIVFDDCTDPNVTKVLRFIRRNCRDCYREVDLSPFRADRGRSLRYHLGKHLNRIQMAAFQKVGSSTRPWNSRLMNF
jgi:cephalosporin hydroxylase